MNLKSPEVVEYIEHLINNGLCYKVAVQHAIRKFNIERSSV